MSTAAQQRHNMRPGYKRQQTQRQRQKRVLIGYGSALVMLIAGILYLGTRAGGNRTADFTASTLTGETVHLSNFHGQVVMLNFWATWCPPCRAEMPAIQSAYEQYHDQGFAVLAINNAEQPAEIQPFADALALRFPVVLDTQRRLSQMFGISGYPTSLFIAPDGEIYARHSGMLSPQQLERYIADGLARIPPDPA